MPSYTYPSGQAPYRKGKPSTTNMQAESTGLQIRNVGTIQMGYGKVKRPRLIGSYFYQNQNQWVMQSAQGLQCVDFPEVILTQPQLLGDTSNVRTERYRWADDPFQLNPWSKRPDNNIYTVTQSDPTARNDMLYIKNVNVACEILSMCLIPQHVTIYWLTPKYDTDINPLDTWNAILAGKNLGQVVAVPAQDIATNTATAGQASGTNPGANPFSHREFSNQWTAICTQKIALQAGEQVNLKCTFEYEKYMARETVVSFRTNTFLKGYTVFPMFIIRAGLVGIASNETNEASEVAYGETKIGVVMNQKYTFGALPISRFSYNRLYPGIAENVPEGTTAESQRVFGDDDTIKNPTVQV